MRPDQQYSPSSGYSPTALLTRFISTLIGLVIYQICQDLILQPSRQTIRNFIWRRGRKKRERRLQNEAQVNL